MSKGKSRVVFPGQDKKAAPASPQPQTKAGPVNPLPQALRRPTMPSVPRVAPRTRASPKGR
jgi:hypothetical protein